MSVCLMMHDMRVFMSLWCLCVSRVAHAHGQKTHARAGRRGCAQLVQHVCKNTCVDALMIPRNSCVHALMNLRNLHTSFSVNMHIGNPVIHSFMHMPQTINTTTDGVYTCMHPCVRTLCLYVWLRAYINHTCSSVRGRPNSRLCERSMCVCIYIYIYIYIYMYMYMHVYRSI